MCGKVARRWGSLVLHSLETLTSYIRVQCGLKTIDDFPIQGGHDYGNADRPDMVSWMQLSLATSACLVPNLLIIAISTGALLPGQAKQDPVDAAADAGSEWYATNNRFFGRFVDPRIRHPEGGPHSSHRLATESIESA
jgi:hypothetical protein